MTKYGGNMESFEQGYIECAFWSSVTDDGTPFDAVDNDPTPETIARMKADCAAFQANNAALLEQANEYATDAQQGHDFWLTRNGHGAGFWDGDYPQELGDALTTASKGFGECDMYIGDDGKIYLS